MNLADKRSRAHRRASAAKTPRGPSTWFSLETLERHVVNPMKEFVDAVLGSPPPDRRRRPGRLEAPDEEGSAIPLPCLPRATAVVNDTRRQLPCDLFLTMGASSVRLFAAGPIEEFAFFQRYRVSDHHSVEFVTRLDAQDRGTEEFKPWGLFRIDGECELLEELERDQKLLALLRGYGLERLPNARQMVSDTLSGYDPAHGDPEKGWNRLEPPRSNKTFKKVAEKRFSYADALEILRRELTGAQKVAWVESALPPPPPASPLVHRYYLDGHKQAFLVRDQRGEPKRLIRAETSEEALQAILASGKFVRRFATKRR